MIDTEHAWSIDPLAAGPYLQEEDYYEEIAPYLSPLYRLKKFEDELPKGNEVLLRAKEYIGGDEAKGKFLCDHFYDHMCEPAENSDCPPEPAVLMEGRENCNEKNEK